MSPEENKAVVRRLVAAVQHKGDLSVPDELAAPGYINHSAPPRVPADREGMEQMTAMFRRAFPRRPDDDRGHARRGDGWQPARRSVALTGGSWVWRQLIEATPWGNKPRHLLHDRDVVYGRDFRRRARRIGTDAIATHIRSPRANAVVERVIGTLRRECLDH